MDFYSHISKNKRKSFLLFFFFFLFILLLGWVLGELYGSGIIGIIIAGIIAVIMILVSYYHSNSIILRISRAKAVTKKEQPYLYNTVESMSLAAGIPTPKCYIIEDSAPNAFATGRDPEHAVIVVTTGLLQKMNRLELEGVIAHEMSHIKNYDIRFMMLVTILVGVSVLLSDLIIRSMFFSRKRRIEGRAGLFLLLLAIILAILTPLIAQLIRLAISRQREFLADASAVQLTRYPEGLASALEKLEKDKEPLEAANKATAHLYIVNPFKKPGLLDNLFSTHPPIKERVKRLRNR